MVHFLRWFSCEEWCPESKATTTTTTATATAAAAFSTHSLGDRHQIKNRDTKSECCECYEKITLFHIGNIWGLDSAWKLSTWWIHVDPTGVCVGQRHWPQNFTALIPTGPTLVAPFLRLKNDPYPTQDPGSQNGTEKCSGDVWTK